MEDPSDNLAGMFPSDVPSKLRRWAAPRLIAWYQHHRRELPWRQDRDPYRIWVSEVMLQQTQVSTVIPFFHRFIARFPTIADLAAASEQEVLRHWEGLGYYRRARDLHAAARLLVQHHHSQIPPDVDALAELPGLGQYTRNAVLSQAFDLHLPIVEANSQRVLSRLLAQAEDPRQGPARRRLWAFAEALLPKQNVGEFNQALMELGALLCTPVAPRCPECPLSARCLARQLGRQEEIPAKPTRPATTFVSESAVVIRRAERVLLAQRPAGGRWAEMWEFPHGELLDEETHERAAVRLAQVAGVEIENLSELATIKHGVTRYRITLVCFEGAHLEGEFRSEFYTRGEWVMAKDLANYPVSAPQRALANRLRQRPSDGRIP